MDQHRYPFDFLLFSFEVERNCLEGTSFWKLFGEGNDELKIRMQYDFRIIKQKKSNNSLLQKKKKLNTNLIPYIINYLTMELKYRYQFSHEHEIK